MWNMPMITEKTWKKECAVKGARGLPKVTRDCLQEYMYYLKRHFPLSSILMFYVVHKNFFSVFLGSIQKNRGMLITIQLKRKKYA